MTEALLLIPSLILGFLLWQEKQDRTLERKERDLKEQSLLNRIQAPEIELMPVVNTQDQFVPFDDDDQFHRSRELLNGPS